VAIGALLFGVRALQASGPTASERPPIEITAERIRELEEEFERRWSAPPSPAQLSAAIEQEIESELLLREARVLGLGLDDASIGRRLVEKMRALAHRPGASPSQLIREAHELGLEYHAQAQRRIAARFGARFAEQLFALPPGTWSGPIPSPFGLHLVVVHETSAGRLPPLAAVRQQVTEAMRAERAALRRKRGIARLRASYEIRVAGHPDLSSSAEVPRS
jgi:hypothetical protein